MLLCMSASSESLMHPSGAHLNLWFEAENGTAQAEGASFLSQSTLVRCR